MKRYIYQMLCMLCISLAAYSQDYYWYNGEKIPLEYGNRQYVLFQDKLLSESDKAKMEYSESVDFPGVPDMKYGLTKPDAVIEDVEHVLYQTQSYKVGNDPDIFVTHYYYVQLKTIDDFSILQDMANQYHAVIEKEGAFALWYVLRWDKDCQYNALELANIFYESGLFSEAEPEFIGSIQPANSSSVRIGSANSLNANKVLRNGIFFIERGGKTYNLQGCKVH